MDDIPLTERAKREAGYLDTLSWLMLLFYVFSVVGMPRRFGFIPWFLLLAVPVMAIRWSVRFRAVHSEEEDFLGAKRSIKIAVGIWIAFVLLFGVPAVRALLWPFLRSR